MDDSVKGCFGIASLIALVVVLLVGGLWRTEVTYIPEAAGNFGTQVPFEEDLTARHFLGGLVQGSQPDLKPVLAKYVRPGEQLTELTVVTRHTFVNNLLTGVTLFIYSPVTVTVRGKVGRTAAPVSQ